MNPVSAIAPGNRPAELLTECKKVSNTFTIQACHRDPDKALGILYLQHCWKRFERKLRGNCKVTLQSAGIAHRKKKIFVATTQMQSTN
jgi:hypothetical protein